ncbi:substance-K receptor-like [Macrobrachium rosenbergii]|uniref:substance-K receptor-like n=1 Tax=Macrobrachium rosenbergii TaxID=79674 RepID=UPI0034D3DFDF
MDTIHTSSSTSTAMSSLTGSIMSSLTTAVSTTTPAPPPVIALDYFAQEESYQRLLRNLSASYPDIDWADINLLNNLTDYFDTTEMTRGMDSNSTSPTYLYEVPTGIVVLLSIFYGSISLVAVVGNSLVMWIVATSRTMHSVTNYFIANLALADIIIAVFAIPFQFQAALLQRWNLPHFMCAFCPFFQTVSVNVSIFTLTAIAVDRYRAIVFPLNARPSKFRSKVVIAFIWLFSTTLAVPQAIALRVKIFVDPVTNEEKPFCAPVGIDREVMQTYSHVVVCLQYFLPLGIISFAYIRMGWELWCSQVPGNAEDARDAHVLRNKKKVIKMLFIVVALFALCWAPLQSYHILQEIYPAVNKYRFINIIWFCCHWLAMSNSCCNPFIYAIYNEKFKREFRHKFRWFFKNDTPSEMSEFERSRYQISFRYPVERRVSTTEHRLSRTEAVALNGTSRSSCKSTLSTGSTLRSSLSTGYRLNASPNNLGRSHNGTSVTDLRQNAQEVHVCVPLKCPPHLHPEPFLAKGDTSM